MAQPSPLRYMNQEKRDLKLLGGFWEFSKKSVTYVAHSNSVNIYACAFIVMTTLTNIILSSIIYINFHTLMYFDQEQLADLIRSFNGIDTTG